MLTFPPVTISDFLIDIPVCQANSDFKEILALFESCEHPFIVVINEYSYPLGLIHVHHLLPHLTKLFSSNHQLVEVDLFPLTNFLIDTKINIVSAQTSIKDFLPLLQGDRPQVFTVVDFKGVFSGLVDQEKLLKFLAHNALALSDQLINLQNESQQLTARNIDLMQMLNWRNQLLASWSHQLKSPVTALAALSNLLQEKKLGQLNNRQANYAQQIYQSSRQLMGLLSLTIDFTYIESGQLILKPKPLDIKNFCQEICQNLQANISIQFEIDPNLKVIVIDHFYLNQILSYLLKNAIDFTPNDGQIGLKIEPWCNWIAFTIWHNGCGIPAENQLSLFEECQPLDNPLSGYFQGTGLEIILSQRLAFACGGDISFVSQLEKGSEFTVLLPPVFPPSLQREKFYNSRLVLIVDLDVIFITNLTKDLRELGYFTIVARSNIEAYRKSYQLKPNFIVINPNLEINSPDFDIFNLLKSDSITKDIKIFKIKHQADLDYIYCEELAQDLILSKTNLFNLLNPCENNKNIGNLTLLLLAPFNLDFELDLSRYASEFNARMISCNSLEQATQIVNFWPIDMIILDARKSSYSLNYWLTLKDNPKLVNLPLVTLDTQITSAINQINNLKVFPYLALPENYSLSDLFKVINIAGNR
jgi:signal transduction histidine kinase